MAKGTHVAEFELYVLLAVVRVGAGAYGVPIRREIEARTGRRVSIGAVYQTLSRLEDKGYVSFDYSDPEPVPGGRSRKLVELTPAGQRAIREAARMLSRMLQGLRLAPAPDSSR